MNLERSKKFARNALLTTAAIIPFSACEIHESQDIEAAKSFFQGFVNGDIDEILRNASSDLKSIVKNNSQEIKELNKEIKDFSDCKNVRIIKAEKDDIRNDTEIVILSLASPCLKDSYGNTTSKTSIGMGKESDGKFLPRITPFNIPANTQLYPVSEIKVKNSSEVALALDYWQAMLDGNIAKLAQDQNQNSQDPMYQTLIKQNIDLYASCKNVGYSKDAKITNYNDLSKITTIQINLNKSCQIPLGSGTFMSANKIYIFENRDNNGKLFVSASPTPLP